MRLMLEFDNLSIKIDFLHFEMSNFKFGFERLKKTYQAGQWWLEIFHI